MRIAILTQPLRYNYGGILQNYALQTILRKMGHEVVTLDPSRYFYPKWKYPFVFLRHAAARYLKGHPEVPIFAEYLQDKETRILGTNTFSFIDNYIQRKEYRYSHKEIHEGDYDAFVVGSDQTWRYKYNRFRLQDMFLSFAKSWDVKRIAYAVSFGTDEWELNDKDTIQYAQLVKLFDKVSVREHSAVILCKEKLGIPAVQVLDPTLMLSKENYLNLVNQHGNTHKPSGDLLCNILDDSDEKCQIIEQIAKSRRLTPFRANSYVENNSSPINERIQPPVEQWLRYFLDSQFVVTDSFHTCVFSIIFNKPFIVLGNKMRGMARFRSLLSMLHLNDHLVLSHRDYQSSRLYDIPQSAYDLLSEKREFALKFLLSALSI